MQDNQVIQLFVEEYKHGWLQGSDQRPTSQVFGHTRGQGLGKMVKTGQVHSNISSAYAKYHE